MKTRMVTAAMLLSFAGAVSAAHAADLKELAEQLVNAKEQTQKAEPHDAAPGIAIKNEGVKQGKKKPTTQRRGNAPQGHKGEPAKPAQKADSKKALDAFQDAVSKTPQPRGIEKTDIRRGMVTPD